MTTKRRTEYFSARNSYGPRLSPEQLAHAKVQREAALKREALRPARRALSSLRMANGRPAAWQGLR